MSIIVKNITKLYGSQKALDNVSFKIGAGEIVGLLGPNGAGKSTLMKIISCFIPPTDGTISVNGHDIFEQSIEVRKKVGYLPENNPLYLDLYIKEYLEFVAGLYKIPNKKSRIKEMIDMTGLGREQNKKIGALSKGYRQRVGLAQALIHDPEVLILDEPTSGLDPNQLLEIRELIKNVGKEKTVMLSTHIMQEVEAICSRAIIIDQGKIVADDSTDKLSGDPSKLQTIEVEFDSNIDQKQLLTIKGVQKADKQNEKQWILQANTKEDIRPLIFEFAVSNKLKVLSMQKSEQSLEMVFQKLTKKKRGN
ncbi:MAG: gliding motility-associated ABC transporter ATP-binding subunit GldA [Bacteroidetes bacterium]|nr:MAG: gliding motility-associated ABC transporter ATP-binding subunit GldA [Bacteroidota bacterium]